MYLAIIICVMTFLLAWWYKRPLGFPPGPRGLPLCGVIPFMTRRPEIKFYQWSKKYGPVNSVRVGRKDWVVLNSYDVIVEAMVRQGQKFLARPPNYVLDNVFNVRNRGIIFASGKVWEVNRKFGNATFRLFGVGKRSFESSVQEEIGFLLQTIGKNVNNSREWRPDIHKAIANVICRVIFGKRFEFTDSVFTSVTKDLMADSWKANVLNMVILLPVLRFIPPIYAIVLEQKNETDTMHVHFKKEIEKHKSEFISGDVRDFIDAFLVEQIREKEEKGNNEYFTDEQLVTYVDGLFGAGGETSASTILWCFLGILHCDFYQERIQAEIRSTIGTETPSMNHRDSMPFTQAYIHEILRYCTLAPLALPHCTTEDAKINGYKIPKGTQVMVNIWAVHNDPDNFKNPSEFRPERFLDSDGNFIRSNRVIPFLVGPRHCLGEQLAKMEIFIFLTSILQKFEIKRDPSSPEELPRMDDGVLGIAYVPKPFKAIFVALE